MKSKWGIKGLLALLVISYLNVASGLAQNGLVKEIILTVDSIQKSPQTSITYLTYNNIETSKPIEPDKWHYVVWSKAADKTGQLYVDGNLVIDKNFSADAYSWNEIYLGTSLVSAYHDFFKGWLDEIRVSNKVRTKDEILNYYNASVPFSADASTVSLWHLNESSGSSFTNAVSGTNAGKIYGNAKFTPGKFGNALYFDGINSYGECNFNMSESNVTIEFWVKIDGYNKNSNNWGGTMIQPYGMYSGNICLHVDSATIEPQKYLWSTGETGYRVTVDPTKVNSVSVSNGIQSDTIFFNPPTAVIHDTVRITNTAVSEGLVAYYPFSGNANDESGHGNNGTVHGATLTKDRFGKENNAYSFDGVSNYIKVINNSLLDVQSNHSFSVSFWIKHDLSKTNFATYIISKYYAYDYSVTSFGIGTDETGNAYSMTLPVPGSYTNDIELRGNRTINDGKWHNFIYTWENGKSASIYIDNIKDTSKLSTIAGSIINSNDLFFGCGVKMTQFYCGNIDDIKIYNRVLDSTEVQSLFTEGTCKETVYDTIHITKTVTETVHLTVTDTLIINAHLTGVAAPDNSNIIKVFPNPANDHISIDFGDFTRMNGYTVKIVNEIGKTVYESIVSQQSTVIDLNSWTGKGVYVINVIDTNNAVIESRTIVLE